MFFNRYDSLYFAVHEFLTPNVVFTVGGNNDDPVPLAKKSSRNRKSVVKVGGLVRKSTRLQKHDDDEADECGEPLLTPKVEPIDDTDIDITKEDAVDDDDASNSEIDLSLFLGPAKNIFHVPVIDPDAEINNHSVDQG
jgi:hypothetical protein